MCAVQVASRTESVSYFWTHDIAHTSSNPPTNTSVPLQRMAALMTSTLPEMMTPQVSSRTAHCAPLSSRTRPTCSAFRPVRRSLFAELDTAPRESPYYQHNGGLSTSATEGLVWGAPRPHLHPSQPLPRHQWQCDSLTLPVPAQAKGGLPVAAVSGSLRRRRHSSEVNDACFHQGE